MQFDPLILIFILGTLLALVLLWVVRLEIKIRALSKGESGKSLEQLITETHAAQKKFESWRCDVEKYLAHVEKRLARSVQAISVKRFNPFRGSGEGGNQSFAVSMLDEKGSGLVLSSIYSRERMSVYAKPLEKHTSTFELTNEEKETIKLARQAISNS